MNPGTKALFAIVLLAELGSAVSCRKTPPSESNAAGSEGASVFASVCANCHGVNGGGNAELKTPSIASLPDWYVAAQVKKFREDLRGTDPGDLTGVQMRAIAYTLDADSVAAVAKHIAALPRIPTANTLGGNPESGKESYKIHCESCHRSRGGGDFFFKSPPLTGLQDWYLLAQLEKFRQRVRGGHPNDIEGQKMQIPAERFLNEKDERDVLAYIASLAEPEEPVRKLE